MGLSKIAMFELLDRGIDQKVVNRIEGVVDGLVDGSRLLAVRNVRGVKSGGELFSFFGLSSSSGSAVFYIILGDEGIP